MHRFPLEFGLFLNFFITCLHQHLIYFHWWLITSIWCKTLIRQLSSPHFQILVSSLSGRACPRSLRVWKTRMVLRHPQWLPLAHRTEAGLQRLARQTFYGGAAPCLIGSSLPCCTHFVARSAVPPHPHGAQPFPRSSLVPYPRETEISTASSLNATSNSFLNLLIRNFLAFPAPLVLTTSLRSCLVW